MLAGTVRDVWVDRTEPQIRYLEVEIAGARTVLLPMNMVQLTWRGQVYVKSILAAQFAGVPAIKNPDQVTKLEEDRITAYYAGGYLYATPSRQEPLI
jgi:photosynthetic reaction center H subunit